MDINDLIHIFKPQIDKSTDPVSLYFMLIDGDYKVVERHQSDDMVGLLPLLESFYYNGSYGNIPRFIK